MRRFIIALALCAVITPASAQEAAGGETPEVVRYDGHTAAEWIGLLSSDDAAQRQKAAYALWNLRAAADDAGAALVGALGDDDAYVRTTSAKALLRLGDAARRSAAPGIAAWLVSEREEVRREAATLLWRLGPLAALAVAGLTAGLDSEDAVVRANAAGALCNAGEAARPALDTLLRLAARDEDAAARRWAGKAAALIDPVRALTSEYREVRLAAANTWARPQHRGWTRDEVCRELVRMVVDQDEDEQVRIVVAHALDTYCALAGKTRPAAWMPLFRRVLENDRAPAVRANGAFGIGRFKGHGPQVVPTLTKAAVSPEPEVQRAAVIALGWLGAEARPAVPAVLRAIQAEDADTRAAAALALGGIGDRSDAVIDALARTLGDSERGTRRHAVRALGTLGTGSQRAEQALIDYVTDPARSTAERGNAARALASIEAGPAAVGALTTLFDRDPEAHSAVAYALVALDSPRAGAALARLIARLSANPAPYAELDLLGLLGGRAAPATQALARLVAVEDTSVRLGALMTLQKIGPGARGARSAVAEATRDADTDVAQAARLTLEALGDAEPDEGR